MTPQHLNGTPARPAARATLSPLVTNILFLVAQHYRPLDEGARERLARDLYQLFEPHAVLEGREWTAQDIIAIHARLQALEEAVGEHVGSPFRQAWYDGHNSDRR
jgi:hypothetical protein